MMQGWVAPAPRLAVPYNVTCSSGHRLRGDRTEGYQALRCPSCGEAVFILPQSPLPEPPVPTPSTQRSPVNQAVLDAYPGDDAPHTLVDPPAWSPPTPLTVEVSDDIADIDWVEEVEPDAPKPGPAPAPKPEARALPGRPARPAAPPRAVTPPRVEITPRLSWREWAWARRYRLVAVAMVALVVGAISIKRWRQRLEELPRIAEIGRSEGFKKLDAGDFFAAKKILADAAAAVDAMGGRFEGADAIRQGALEAALLTDLVPRTLEDLVEEAATYRKVEGWSAHFASMYRGRSILLETTITAVPDPAKPGSRYADAYRIMFGRGPKPEAKGRLDYSGFELFELTQPKVGETKLFGARLAGLEFDRTESVWIFTLEPDSGAFITHTQALEAIYWPTGDSVEETGP